MTNLFQPGSRLRPVGRLLLAGLALALLPLLAWAGPPVLTFQGFSRPTDRPEGTVFIDQVEVLNMATGAVVPGAVFNGSFEAAASLGSGTYGFVPAGASWVFATGAGIAANGSPLGNPAAPDGTRVGLLQSSAAQPYPTFEQMLANLAPGLYQLRMQVAQRPGQSSQQILSVQADGALLGSYLPPDDGAFHVFLTKPFVVGTILSVKGITQPASSVSTRTFLDQVELVNVATGAVVPGGVPNGSFETGGPLAEGQGTVGFGPEGTGWLFSGADGSAIDARGGIAATGSPLGNPPAPNGTRLAFVQDGGLLRLILPALPPGTYQVRMQVAQSPTSGNLQGGVQLLVDQAKLGTYLPPADNVFRPFVSKPFVVGTVLRIEATGSPTAGNADVTAFVDDVVFMTDDPEATGPQVSNSSFEYFGSLNNGLVGYLPPGAGWQFEYGAGIATTGSALGNPATLAGTHVAFLQKPGAACSQTLPAMLAGTYQLRLALAQRNTPPADQTVRVLLNNRELGRFKPVVGRSLKPVMLPNPVVLPLAPAR